MKKKPLKLSFLASRHIKNFQILLNSNWIYVISIVLLSTAIYAVIMTTASALLLREGHGFIYITF